jgi:hypothetical protein
MNTGDPGKAEPSQALPPPMVTAGWGQILAALCPMSESRLSDMIEAEFDAMIEGHIEWMAHSERELEADVVVDLLLERIAAKAEAPVTVAIDELFQWLGFALLVVA